jgi:topoisomerase-4 subunit A
MTAHNLPSARGQGEPVTGRINPPAGSSMVGLMLDIPSARYLLASDGGYGFVARVEDLLGKNKAGKSVLSVPKGCNVMPPKAIPEGDGVRVAAVSNEGRLLVFALSQLPEMAKGKGNKMIDIPGAKAARREEFVRDLVLLPEGASLIVHAGKRKQTLKTADLEYYTGERGRRGSKLARGFQKVDRLEVES